MMNKAVGLFLLYSVLELSMQFYILSFSSAQSQKPRWAPRCVWHQRLSLVSPLGTSCICFSLQLTCLWDAAFSNVITPAPSICYPHDIFTWNCSPPITSLAVFPWCCPECDSALVTPTSPYAWPLLCKRALFSNKPWASDPTSHCWAGKSWERAPSVSSHWSIACGGCHHDFCRRI